MFVASFHYEHFVVLILMVSISNHSMVAWLKSLHNTGNVSYHR